uniref:Myosin head n=1 Tax=Syphacia muris TaxID=451379 RepID=A0A0N5AQ10_9BILA
MADYENDPGWQYLRQSYEETLKDQSKPYDSKKNVWIPDVEEGYVEAEIKSVKDDIAIVISRGNEINIKMDLIQEMNPPKFEKVEDMSNLTFLNDASVLHNLRARYKSMLLYTYSGLFCVVINPYKRLPIYTDSVARMYMGKRKTEMPPHLFAVSDEAYRSMLINQENQSMLITGESGAGKTENTKKVIAYFAAVGASQQEKSTENEESGNGKKKVTLEDQIVQTNPVLEAFGNARTVRNNNSSRFGKFIRIHFSKQGKVASCDIEHYLLEKSRVIRQAPGERCYHIFYQLCSGYLPNLKKELLIDKPLKDYWFIAQAELTIDGVNDKEEHQLTDEAFDILHFSSEEKMDCYKLMSAIMHMGNMKFKQRPREEQAEPDGTEEAEKAAKMYGINHEEFLKALTRPRVKVGTEWVAKGQNLEQVNWAVGAMAKGLYARVFNWLVKKCNKTLDQKGIPRDYFIGVLDIAGFEIFDFNSFEQLWINFVNEKLQQFFNHHMFVLEQEEYAREGIKWTFIDFGLDLEACIELIEKPLGIISILDEECIVPKATDLTLAQKLIDQHLGKHPNFEKPKPPKGKQGEAHFAMRHYAGTVRYNVTNWLEKNKDPLSDTCVTVMKASQGNRLLVEVWQDYTTQEEAAAAAKGGVRKKGKSGSFMTVSMLYRESLNTLMNMLNMTHPHFIRCIIPNERKTSGIIEASLVLNQLTCNGVLEGIRICRKGFPNRLLHGDFKQRYSLLAAEESKCSPDPKECAERILEKLVKTGVLSEENFRIGYTKVFLKAGILAHLEDYRDEVLRTLISNLQAFIRSYLGIEDKKRKEEQKIGLLIVQRNVRKWCSLRRWDWFTLYCKVRPLLREGKVAEEMEKLRQQIAELENKLKEETNAHKKIVAEQAKIDGEKAAYILELENVKTATDEVNNQLAGESSRKADVDKTLQETNDSLVHAENDYNDLIKAKDEAQSEVGSLKKLAADLEVDIRKAESERTSKERELQSLKEEMQQQTILVTKLHKEIDHQSEVNKRMTRQLQDEEVKSNQIFKLKVKLEQRLDDFKEHVESEKQARADAEKAKRKAEGDVRIANEDIEECSRQKQDLESSLKRKENEYSILSSRFESEQATVSKLQRQFKELQVQASEIEDEIQNVRDSRIKSEHARGEIEREIVELQEQLNEQGRVVKMQIEVNKKREAEMANLRKAFEESQLTYQQQIAALNKKRNDAIANLNEQHEEIMKKKQQCDKELVKFSKESQYLSSQLKTQTVAKQKYEKVIGEMENQMVVMKAKSEEQCRQFADERTIYNRLISENRELSQQLENNTEKLNNLKNVKAQLNEQASEAKRMLDDEIIKRQALSAEVKKLELELEQVHSNLDEVMQSKNESLRQLGRAMNDIQQLQSKYNDCNMFQVSVIQEAQRKQNQRIDEILDELEAANHKVTSLESSQMHMLKELDDVQIDVEQSKAIGAKIQQKQDKATAVVDEWKKKSSNLKSELEAVQRESRNTTAELLKIKNSRADMDEVANELRNENKLLSKKLEELNEQIKGDCKTNYELQKVARRIEAQKQELQRNINSVDNAIEMEEKKLIAMQVEIQLIKSNTEKQLKEKDEEFQCTRNNHHKARESIKALFDGEARSKAELLKLKKSLESDIDGLEISLDQANKTNSDIQKTIHSYTERIRDIQLQIESEQKQNNDLKDEYHKAEKHVQCLESEKKEMLSMFDRAQRARRTAENEVVEVKETAKELVVQTTTLDAAKRKTEAEIESIRSDVEATLAELRKLEDSYRAATADINRLNSELHQEQEHHLHVGRIRINLEQQIKALQAQMDGSNLNGLNSGKKMIRRLEERLTMLERQLDIEQRKCKDANRAVDKSERHIRELEFQLEENKNAQNRMQDVVEKLQSKIKLQKRQLEEMVSDVSIVGNLPRVINVS